jgi:hypothetical protein
MSYIHLGSNPIDRYALEAVPTPAPIGPRHQPYGFADYANRVADALQTVGLSVTDEAYGLTHENKRMFGLMEVEPTFPLEHDGYKLLVALRGSHDNSMARTLAAGSEVTICTNMCISGEVQVNTKQTTHIARRMPGLILDAVKTLRGVFQVQEQRFAAYKEFQFKPSWADAALTRLVRVGAVPPSSLGRVISEWDSPSYEEHTQWGMSAWRMMQAVTETYKSPLDETGAPTRMTAPVTTERSIKLTRFLDSVVGLDVAH